MAGKPGTASPPGRRLAHAPWFYMEGGWGAARLPPALTRMQSAISNNPPSSVRIGVYGHKEPSMAKRKNSLFLSNKGKKIPFYLQPQQEGQWVNSNYIFVFYTPLRKSNKSKMHLETVCSHPVFSILSDRTETPRRHSCSLPQSWISIPSILSESSR